jgi:dinuclear metal center YbgI/SA1388 family protein
MLVKDVLGILDRIAPFSLQLDWDNSGLQVGDPGADVNSVAVALDPTTAVMDEALKLGAGLLIAHHPLIFKPLRSLAAGDPAADAACHAVKNGLAVISTHTPYDCSGMGRALCDFLGLRMTGFLEAVPSPFLKLVVFVPEDAVARVMDAAFKAGAGAIGDYSRCSFSVSGEGTFLPGPAASPALGQRGKPNTVPECRVEALVPRGLQERVERAVRESHPYEEPALDFLESSVALAHGFGAVGEWEPAIDPLPFLAERFSLGAIQVAGRVPRRVARAALMPGSGGGYAAQAKRAGAEILVTGDLGHHQALLANDLGIPVVSAGHFQTENPGMRALAGTLSELMPGTGVFFIDGACPVETWTGTAE